MTKLGFSFPVTSHAVDHQASVHDKLGGYTSSKSLKSYCCNPSHADNDRMKTIFLFVLTALAEIVGCYLPYLWLAKDRTAWLLVPAAISLALFAYLLTLHPEAAGRVYAAYGGIYITVALAWLWAVDGIRPTSWDAAGVAISLLGMSVIAFQPRQL